MSVDRRRRRLRAPSEDRGVLIDPPLADASARMAHNQTLWAHWSWDFAGQDALQMRQSARRHLLEQAIRYTGGYRDLPPSIDTTNLTTPIVLTGHQPELFHPGVWFKNFVLHTLGHRLSAVPIHLLIDNDLCSNTSLRIPTGSVDSPTVSSVALDQGEPLPYEERRVVDVECFSSFAERAGVLLKTWGYEPLLRRIWPWACESLKAPETLGARLARTRHRLEQEFGLETLEVPLSVVCDGESFVRFVADLIGRFESWHATYNQALTEFRKINRMRSQTHPVPDLNHVDGWYEVPLWVWSESDPIRRRPYIRCHDSCIEMKIDAQVEVLGRESNHASIAEALHRLRGKGVKLRPRAIVTTLFSRLFLGDLFLHGIGGAKYDELTDVLIERLYQVKPPGFFTVTATLRLPIAHAHIAPERAAQLKQAIRGMRYHPERYLSANELSDARVSRWVDEKQHWVRQSAPRGSGKERHDAIQAANQALSMRLEDRFQTLRGQLDEVLRGLRRQAVLESREYSFCLFPCKFLQDALFDCLSRGA